MCLIVQLSFSFISRIQCKQGPKVSAFFLLLLFKVAKFLLIRTIFRATYTLKFFWLDVVFVWPLVQVYKVVTSLHVRHHQFLVYTYGLFSLSLSLTLGQVTKSQKRTEIYIHIHAHTHKYTHTHTHVYMMVLLLTCC